jgi:hypothetical protein
MYICEIVWKKKKDKFQLLDRVKVSRLVRGCVFICTYIKNNSINFNCILKLNCLIFPKIQKSKIPPITILKHNHSYRINLRKQYKYILFYTIFIRIMIGRHHTISNSFVHNDGEALHNQ